MAVHKFDLATAGQHDSHEFWPTFYTRAFPGYLSHEVVTEKRLQIAGIDHRLKLEGDGEHLVDVKCRCTSPTWRDDVLIEVWSDRDRKIKGWARKPLRCHLIAYAWPQYEVGFVVPFLLLRRTYERNKKQWAADGLRLVDARNEGYTTRSVAVPIDRLTREVAESMTVYFKEDQEPWA